MKLVQPYVTLIEENNPIKKVELIGRTCYKSEDKITDDSCMKFLDSLISRSHYAMLEHANMTFEIRGLNGMSSSILNLPYVRYTCKNIQYEDSPEHHELLQYVTVSLSHIVKWSKSEYELDDLSNLIFRMFEFCFKSKYCNLKVDGDPGLCSATIPDGETISVKILENVDEIAFVDEHDLDTHSFCTVKFVCDRGVSHELVRHRCGVAQESTRYCNYTKEKFGQELMFIKPADFDNFNVWSHGARDSFIYCCETAEATYKRMINNFGMSPQQARAVLPNSLKTEVILTMPRWQWKHFINLRSIGTTGSPHPDMKVVADMAHNLLKEKKFL